MNQSSGSIIGVLASGGLDSCVLMAHLLRQGHDVQPFYVRCGLLWEKEELSALQAFLRVVAAPGLDELLVFDLPLEDLYGKHWSIDGRDVPDAETADDAVYLPGRNALLGIKPALWCGMHGIGQLALATLAGNPFPDATDEFFRDFETVLQRATGNRVSFLHPFAAMKKEDVVQLGKGFPLELTFSCFVPDGGRHCGRCNKCAERQRAFSRAGVEDATKYVFQPNSMKGEGMTKHEGRMTKE
jgi:7-cyano-7-deazaguanine synthase